MEDLDEEYFNLYEDEENDDDINDIIRDYESNDIIEILHETIFSNIDIMFKNVLSKEIELFKLFLLDNIQIVKKIKHNNKYYFHLFVIFCKNEYNINLKKYHFIFFEINYKPEIISRIRSIYSLKYPIKDIEDIYDNILSSFKGILLYLKIITKKEYDNIIKCFKIFSDGKEELDKIISIFNEDAFYTTKELTIIIKSSLFIISKILLLLIKNNILDYKLELLVNISMCTFFKCMSLIAMDKKKYKEVYFLIFNNNKEINNLMKFKGLFYLFYYLDKISFIKSKPKCYKFLNLLKNIYEKNNLKL